MNCDPYAKHKLEPKHNCTLTCDCKKKNSFSSGTLGTSLGQCDGGIPGISVETYTGGAPGTTGSMFVSSAQLELCDSLQFWTDGTTELNVQEGSAQVGIEAANIISGSGEPLIVPAAPNRNFIYNDVENGVLYAWAGPTGGWIQVSVGGGGTGSAVGNDFWRTKSGDLPDGANDTNKVIQHFSDLCIGRSGNVPIGEGLIGDNNVLFGPGALTNNIGDANIGIGLNAGGNSSGQNPNDNRVAIGNFAGVNGQRSNSVAIGPSCGQDQGIESVAIGNSAGGLRQKNCAVAIGDNAGNIDQGDSTVAIGNSCANSNQSNQSIAIGFNAGNSFQGATGSLAAINNTEPLGQSIAIGKNAGATNQRAFSIAIGSGAQGSFTAPPTDEGVASIAIGFRAGFREQGNNAIAIGQYAGDEQAFDSVAIGRFAGRSQAADSVAIGCEAGSDNQSSLCVAIGANAGKDMQRTESIAIGPNAGENNQMQRSIAIGRQAGQNNLAESGIAIGERSACTGTNGIAIGSEASVSMERNIAIGNNVAAARTNSIMLDSSGVGAPIGTGVSGSEFSFFVRTKQERGMSTDFFVDNNDSAVTSSRQASMRVLILQNDGTIKRYRIPLLEDWTGGEHGV